MMTSSVKKCCTMIASDTVVYTTVRAAPKYALIAERIHTAEELRQHLIVSVVI